jgi:hypothetical protein
MVRRRLTQSGNPEERTVDLDQTGRISLPRSVGDDHPAGYGQVSVKLSEQKEIYISYRDSYEENGMEWKTERIIPKWPRSHLHKSRRRPSNKTLSSSSRSAATWDTGYPYAQLRCSSPHPSRSSRYEARRKRPSCSGSGCKSTSHPS